MRKLFLIFTLLSITGIIEIVNFDEFFYCISVNQIYILSFTGMVVNRSKRIYMLIAFYLIYKTFKIKRLKKIEEVKDKKKKKLIIIEENENSDNSVNSDEEILKKMENNSILTYDRRESSNTFSVYD